MSGFLLLLNLPLYFFPDPHQKILGKPLLYDSYRWVPGTRQKCSLALLPKDKKPRAHWGSLLYKSWMGCLESRLLLPSEIIGSHGTILPLLLWSPALGWPCFWHLLPHFLQAAGNSMLGFCQWEATVCCSKLLRPCCFVKAVFQGSMD